MTMLNFACLLALLLSPIHALEPASMSRRGMITKTAQGAAGIATIFGQSQVVWGAAAVQDSLDIDSFLRSGQDIGGNMGVSSQAGKSRPETGVFLRDGSEVSRDPRSGSVLAEIILEKTGGGRMASLASYSSPWPLAKGSFFDVECRDGKTGDGAFLAVSQSTGGRSIADIPDSFFLDNLLASTGRFSFYGQPTDVRIKKSVTNGDYRFVDLSFATLSQSTQTEIPRKAQLVATIPSGSAQAVMLVGSASTTRWNKGSDKDIFRTAESFRAIPAPGSSMKLRKKDRGGQALFLD